MSNINYNYTNLPPFKWFVLENFPFIEADFDALTNWQLFCKLGKEMNKIIKILNDMGVQVENITNAFIELQNYVNNYFENLDVQEEINNKLDEMAENGTLAEIVASYLSTRALFVFDTVALMKEAENLEDGSYAKTLGFYEKNDKGNAIYKIRTKTNEDVIDESLIIEISDSLVAELCIEEIMTVKQFGATGNSSTDDTAKIQKCLNNCQNVIVPAGTYMVNALTSLLPNSNQNITLDKNAIIKAIPNNSDSYAIIKIANKENINITGGTIYGERELHDGSTGEWGNGISIIQGSKNIKLENILITKCWGDGIYINNAENIYTKRIVGDNNRRQGMSIINVRNFYSKYDVYKNTSGTAPSDGVDIEPNYDTDVLYNINFENLVTENNAGAGFQMFINHTFETPITINLKDYKDTGSTDGIGVALKNGNTGSINLENIKLFNNGMRGLASNGFFGGETLKLKVKNILVKDSNQNEETAFNYSVPVVFYNTLIENPTEHIGNIEIEDFYIDCPKQTNQTCLGFSTQADNVYIKNPLFRRGNIRARNQMQFKDEYEKYVIGYSSNTEISFNNVFSEYNMSNTTGNRAFTLMANIPVGLEFKVVNNSDYIMRLPLDSTLYCKNFATTPGFRINLEHYGDAITFKKISATELIATNIVGTPTIDNVTP